MCPVEIGVMHNEHQRKSCKKIEPAMLFDLCAMRCVWFNIWILDKKKRNKGKHQHGDNGIRNLPEVISYFRKSLLNFFIRNPFTQQYISQQKGNTSNIEI